ncbi:MAG TPA: LysM domain-containing protein [Polyangiaceae bacterium]|nr:LysM domain-containing protein [Polyangiaceae bacterium]
MARRAGPKPRGTPWPPGAPYFRAGHPRRPGAALGLAAALAAASLGHGAPAHAFPHVVQKGETLAQIAERIYGLVEMEKVLVAANGLDAGGGIAISPGMRLEVPALGHRRVGPGDSWGSLAFELLGGEDRSDVIAMANDSSPWLTPREGAEIVVPYNLRVTVGQADNIVTIAQRYLGSKDKAWSLARYNHLQDSNGVRRGDVLLVPLGELKLTEEGKAEAARAEGFEKSEGGGAAREAQKRADAELPALLADVRAGRYVDAVVRGAKVLGYGELARPQLGAIHRQLLEAYVALEAPGLAFASCRAWRELDPAAKLDPVYLSPKIVAACESAARGSP